MATDRKVTGKALSRILTEVKEYIDNRVIGFEEFEVDPETGSIIDPETGLELEDVNFGQYGELYSEDIINILGETFNDTDNTK